MGNRRLERHDHYIISDDILGVLQIIVVIGCSLIEAFGTSWKISFAYGLLLSVLFSFLAVIFTLQFEDFAPDLYELEFSGLKFELVSYIAAAYRVLALFMWKQTLMAAY